ncbi:MAG: exosortase C-terminal domain/associated protein EpsI, partial [Betaproteobacteria bacterium]
RVLFLVASILVPIIANWMRAYMIVMIGHLSDNQLAVGVDHIIYGWIFFGFVMALLFWVGSFWNEDSPPVAVPASRSAFAQGGGTSSSSTQMLFVAAVAAFLAAAVWRPALAVVDRQDVIGTPVVPAIVAGNGWVPSAAPIASWKPHYVGFANELQQTFHRDAADVGVYVAYYVRQEKGRELVTSGNSLTPPKDWTWKLVGRGSTEIPWAGHGVTADTAELSGLSMRLLVWRLFWVDGRLTSSEYVAKALLAWSKLSGHGDDSALIVIYTPTGETNDRARETLRAFVDANAPAIERSLADARRSAR